MEFKLEKAMQIEDYNKICTNLLACNLCGAATLDSPMPRKRHKIFGKARFTDRRGELCSPAFKIYNSGSDRD